MMVQRLDVVDAKGKRIAKLWDVAVFARSGGASPDTAAKRFLHAVSRFPAGILELQSRFGLHDAEQRANAAKTFHFGFFALRNGSSVVALHQLTHPLLVLGGELNRQHSFGGFWRHD